MRSKSLISTMLLSILAAFILSCNQPGKINFHSKVYDKIKVKYWINTTTGRTERSLTVTNEYDVSTIKEKMIIEDVVGLTIAAGSQLSFVERNGTIWNGEIVFENSIILHDRANPKDSYSVKFKNNELYDFIVNMCVQQEKLFYPDVTSKHIILRSNLIKEYEQLEAFN